MNSYFLIFFIITSPIFCSFDEQDFIQEDSECCIEYEQPEVSDEEFEEIVEYLMSHYRENIRQHPELYEYFEEQLERIEKKKEE